LKPARKRWFDTRRTMRYCDDCGKWCKEQHGLTRPYRTHFETLLTTLTAVLAHPDWASGYGGCGEEDVDDDQEDQDQVRAGDRDPVLYGGACGVRGSRGGRDSESGHLDFRI